MAKLTPEVLDAGRILVRAKDMDGFKVWCERHAFTVSWSEIEKSFGPLFKADQVDMALKLFDKFFPSVDTARDVRQGLGRLGCVLFVALGALGGIVYLVTRLF
jgi:hypothetical protein